MAERVRLVSRLAQVDADLRQDREQSYRSSAVVRELLRSRRLVCDEMLTVGFQPWPMPVGIEEAKAI